MVYYYRYMPRHIQIYNLSTLFCHKHLTPLRMKDYNDYAYDTHNH